MTYEEIEKIIKDNYLQDAFFYSNDMNINYGQFYEELENHDLFKGLENEEINKKLAELGLENFENVHYVCNTDEVQSVTHFKNDDIYISLTGWYDSYGGYDHDVYKDVKQVFPKKVENTIYE